MAEDPCKKSPKPSTEKFKFPVSLKQRLPKLSSDFFERKILKSLSDWRNLLKHSGDSGLSALKTWILQTRQPSKMADKAAGPPARPMKYPYTFSAKFAQFPLGHYIKNQWIWKYYFLSVAACVPVFYSIHKLANSPGNVAKWAEIRRKEAAEHH